MARMFPPNSLGGSTPTSERKVFEALSELDDDWMVFHSVAWQGERGRRQGDGEADFVVAHPRRGVLVLEVKGGEISLVDGQWFTTDHHGNTFPVNPFEQVRHSKHVLGEYLAEKIPAVGAKVQMGHGVVFPDVDVDRDLSPEAPREVIIDAADLEGPVAAIERLARHWSPGLTTFDATQFSALRQALAPTVRIRRRLRHRVDEAVEEILDLTREQTRLLSLLRLQRRMLVIGGPGTGKTVLAVERARQLAAEGERVLLVCFNKLLGDHLAAEVADDDGVTAGNFHGLAYEWAQRAGILPPGDLTAEFWSHVLPDLVPEAAGCLGIGFDALVVDEGQDFLPDWWTLLQLLLEDPDEGRLAVFADRRQSIYIDRTEYPVGTEPFVLDVNCRNTEQIAAKVAGVFGEESPTLGAEGLPCRFVAAETDDDMISAAIEECDELRTTGGMAPDRIVVLSTRKRLVEEIRNRQGQFGSPGGKGIVAETVHRFKGLESDAVVLLVPGVESERDRALAYVGMSRARAHLTVIGPREVRTKLGWDG